MRKTILFCFVFLIYYFAGVYAQSIYEDNDLRYTGIEEVRNYRLHHKKNNPACNLKINFFYPEVMNDKELQEKIQSYFIGCFFDNTDQKQSPEKAVKEYAEEYVENYKDIFERSGTYKNEEEKAKQAGKDIAEFQFLYTYEKTMRNTILFNRGNIISQVINIYEYTGGAHGASFTKGSVYDIDEGKELSYNDVFYEGANDAIAKLLQSYLMQKRKYADEDAMIAAGFNSPFIYPSPNFVADDQGITFIYNPYELGSYVLGIVEIVIPYTELYLYMKPESTLFRWAKNYFTGNWIKYETSYLSKDFFAYDPKQFPGFISQIQFTYPNAYYDLETLGKLQKQFIANAFGERYASHLPSEVVHVFYREMLSAYETVAASDEAKKKGQEILGKEFTQTNVFHLNQDDLISYEIVTYSSEGMSDGVETSKGYTIRLPQAVNLSYEDVFKPGSKKYIQTLIENQLLKQKGYQTVGQLTKEGYRIALLMADDNFYLDTEGITFILGAATKVKITYDQLKNYLLQ